VRKIILVGAVAVTAAVGVLTAIAPAAASTSTVTITNPTAAATVEGDLAVTVTAVPGPGTRITGVEIITHRVDPADTRYQWMPLTGCDVTTVCTGTVTVRTEDMANGANSIQADVFDSASTVAMTSIAITVDNPKPSVAITSVHPGDRLWGTTEVQIDAQPAVRPDGRPVTAVRLYWGDQPLRQSDGTVTWGNGTLATATTAPYRMTLTFAGVPRSGSLTAVAYDDLGDYAVASVPVVVHPGLALSVRPDPGYPNQTVINGAAPIVDFSAAEPADANPNPNLPGFWIAGYALVVDGTTVRSWSWPDPDPACGGCTPRPQIAGWMPVALAGDDPHTLSLTATDNAGVTSTTSTTVMVDKGLTIAAPTWSESATTAGTALSDGQVIRLLPAGHSGYLHLSAQTLTSGSWVQADEIDIDGQQVSLAQDCTTFVGCSTRLDAARPWVPTPGRHTLTVHISTPATTATLTRTLSVLPAAVLKPGASTLTVAAGQQATLTAHLTRYDTAQPVAGQTVTLQWQAAGTTTWSTVAARSTSSTGAASVTVTPTGNGAYRWVYAQTTAMIGATSPSERVSVTTKVTAKASTTTLSHTATLKITVTEAPKESGVLLSLQRYVTGTGWVTIATTHESSTGTATFAVKLPTGSQTLRVVKAATTRYATSISTSLKVSVT
jgi:hypothetical protein